MVGYLGDTPPERTYLDYAVDFATRVATAGSDAVRDAEILRAELSAAISRGMSSRKIDLIRAKLVAAERAARTQLAAEKRKREWDTIAKVGAVLGVVAVLGLTVSAVRRGVR